MNHRTVEQPNSEFALLSDSGTPLSWNWYVIWARSHSEQLVHDELEARGFQAFLPRMDVWRRRNGTRTRVSVPMFPGYLFLHHIMDKSSYLTVVQTRGVIKLLGEQWDRLAVVSDKEIEAIWKIHHAHLPTSPHPYLREGQRVRITEGLLAGVEGILLRSRPNRGMLVVSIELLRRSVAVELDCTIVAPI